MGSIYIASKRYLHNDKPITFGKPLCKINPNEELELTTDYTIIEDENSAEEIWYTDIQKYWYNINDRISTYENKTITESPFNVKIMSFDMMHEYNDRDLIRMMQLTDSITLNTMLEEMYWVVYLK